MTTLSIVGGRLIDPQSQHDAVANVHIADGRIVAIGDTPDNFHAQRHIDASRQIVCPGLIDLCARLGEPGYKQRGTIHSETRAAALAGVTSITCLPDTQPIIDEPAVVELILHRAAQAQYARVLPIGAVTRGLKGELLTEMSTLYQQGCVGLSQANQALGNTRVLRRAMEYASTFDIPLLLQPQDACLADGGCMHEGSVSTRLGLPGIPAAAESIAISQLIELAAMTGVRLHLSRITSQRGVAIIRAAKRDRIPITADTSINHLHLTDIDVGGFNSLCHTQPPLRNQRDREALIDGLIDGTIDAVCSDHNPCENDAKMAPFQATHVGISSVEVLLPLLLRLSQNGLSTLQLLALVTAAPAKILSLERGKIAVGSTADLCIYDPEQEWEAPCQTLISQGKNTPYAGWMLKGKVRQTLIGGQPIKD